jgi:hypothetical protein
MLKNGFNPIPLYSYKHKRPELIFDDFRKKSIKANPSLTTIALAFIINLLANANLVKAKKFKVDNHLYCVCVFLFDERKI